jgi:dipeptidase E
MKKILFFLISLFFLFLISTSPALATLPRPVFIQKGDVKIENPEVSQLFYDELKGKPRDYIINSSNNFTLKILLLVPEIINREGRYSADIFSIKDSKEEKIGSLDGASSAWEEVYQAFDRDYYLKGPDYSNQLPAGKYKIEVYSTLAIQPGDNQGKYVLGIGDKESYTVSSFINVYWQLPLIKNAFLKTSVLQFFLTPFGIAAIAAIGAIIILLFLLNFIFISIRDFIKHQQAKTLLLTSAGMQMKDEIRKLLQKPAYDITVGFITTAAKPEEDLEYLKRDWNIMKDEMGFNVEEIDIEGKTEKEVMKLLQLKDIIFVEGGNTFYLLKAMRACKFEKVIRKLLKLGKVYIGVSAGTIVAGKTIRTASWYGDKNLVGLRNLRGLNLVPFDIFVHYNRKPDAAEIIRKKMPLKWARKKLKIITDDQAVLVQAREVLLIGGGEEVVV